MDENILDGKDRRRAKRGIFLKKIKTLTDYKTQFDALKSKRFFEDENHFSL